jgi:hypothetical protein
MHLPMALFVAALAGPSAMALAVPPEALPWLAAYEGLREKVDGFEIFKEETREKHAVLDAKVERLTKQNEEQQEQIDQCNNSPPRTPPPAAPPPMPSPSDTGKSRWGLHNQGPSSRGEAATMYKVLLSTRAGPTARLGRWGWK